MTMWNCLRVPAAFGVDRRVVVFWGVWKFEVYPPGNGKSFGWWFGTRFIFHNIWDNPSHWLIFCKMVKTTNQSCLLQWWWFYWYNMLNCSNQHFVSGNCPCGVPFSDTPPIFQVLLVPCYEQIVYPNHILSYIPLYPILNPLYRQS